MDDISSLIIEAWDRILPAVLNDPKELARRLARRRMKVMGAATRAWCVAIRASDTRISPRNAMIVPEDAGWPRHAITKDARRTYIPAEHQVTFTKQLVSELCRPVTIEPAGMTVQQVSDLLGVHKASLEYAIRRGVFRVVRARRSWVRTERFLDSEEVFDPCSSSLKRAPDEACGSTWGRLGNLVPDTLEQTVTRVPWWRGRLKDIFIGWRWICPARTCGRAVRTLFYPVPPINLPKFFGVDPASSEIDALAGPAPTFACVRCHGVRYFNRIGPNPWNELVHHLSGGLLYGHEVARPTWLKPVRRKEFRSQLGRAPSLRRAEVLERLLKGWSYRQIASDIGSGYATVHKCVDRIYREHRVHSREELIRSCGPGKVAGESGEASPASIFGRGEL